MKRITTFIRLLVCLIFMAATTQHALAAIDIKATKPANGTGTAADPYQISTPGELYWFAARVNAGQTTINAKLTADIVVNENVLQTGTFNLNGTPANVWTPIGDNTNQFKGTFDGNNHTISGLYFKNTGSSNYPKGGTYIGLISYGNGATIKNVVVKDSYINGYTYVAGICGYANGSTTISNCGYEGAVYSSGNAYGITYNYSATVKNCYSVSNAPLASKSTTNCYYDKTKYTTSSNTTGKPSTAFASGEVAWLLKKGDSDSPWGQKVGTDATPVLGGDKVYVIAICPHATSYTNTECVYTPIADGDEHYDADGFCKVCGAGHPATLVGEYYEIDDVAKLYWFAAQVNAGQTTINAKLAADMVVNENVLQPGTFDLNGTPANVWTPIGNKTNQFKGTFDGNGHTISGLYFNNTANADENMYIALIGYASGATIKNVVVRDSYLNGYNYVAGICGYAAGSTTITNCGFEGYSKTYGITYNYSATVKNCYSIANKPLAYRATTNCYHDNTKCTALTLNSIGKPSTAFASGDVAWLLNGGSSDGPWGQTIGTDATPKLGGNKVYPTAVCAHANSYSNTESVYTPIADGDEQYDAEGLCKVCGAKQPATLVDGYYEIDNVGKLYWFAAQVNAGQTTINAKLTADIVVNENVLQPGTINLNGTPQRVWTPIGRTYDQSFKGTFDGNNHTISGLYFNNTANADENMYIALIGYASGATIKNVVVRDSYLNGYNYVAGICGYAAGSTTITNCGFEGYSKTYGITYNYSATVKNCYSVSNSPLAYSATSNCYHDNTKYTGSTINSTGKPSTAFASGEVAWLLKKGDSDSPWGQKVGTDATPVLGGDKVYATEYTGCAGIENFSNVGPSKTEERDHVYEADGVCTRCGFYVISNADQLFAFAAAVNSGQTSLNAQLAADIVVNENVLNSGTFDLNGTPANVWTPIGTYSKPFKGTFDGNNHTISGLYFYNNTSYSNYPAGGRNIGLIGYGNGATIKNVVVKDSYLYGHNYYVAGICGYSTGSTQITNCGYEGYSSGFGIVCNEDAKATVNNCYSVSNKFLSYKATTNCYYDNSKYTSSTTYSTGKPSSAFANGEVAFLLGDAWGQTIGTDALPKLGGNKVYKNTYSGDCPGEGYSNVDEHGLVTDRNNHSCDVNGICIQCGIYIISNADQLFAFAQKVNSGQTTLNAKLTADIVVNENVLQTGTFNLNGTPANEWTPIGTYSKKFAGTFDGNGHTISGLYFNNRTNSNYPNGGKYTGLIGYAEGATIKNVVVKDSYINGYDYVAGICGYAIGSTKISNCGFEGYTNKYGIARNFSSTVENCYVVSNALVVEHEATNCYHDHSKSSAVSSYSHGKSSVSFANGEVAYLLGDAWGQTIGTDATPRLGGDKVYKNTYSGECPGEGYSNVDEHGIVTDRNHNWNAEGICTHCLYYHISSADHLFAFAKLVNSGQKSINAKLMADIVVNENVLRPGTFTLNGTPEREWTPINGFQGTFDGNCHTISGLYYNNTANSYVGLIGIGNMATIKNVVVKDSYIKGYEYVAGICGYTKDGVEITNCGFEGYVDVNRMYRQSYGIAYNYSDYDATIENCYSVSNSCLACNKTTNCYHDNTKYTDLTEYSIGKTSEEFANGEVAYRLNEGNSDAVWGQKIGVDATPKLNGDKVYATALCPHTGAYSNAEDASSFMPDGDEHYDSNGFCKICGAYQTPKLVGSYYEIDNAGKLYGFAALVNGGQNAINAKLTADIVVNENVLQPGTFKLNGIPQRMWTPMGALAAPYRGTFDGNNHTISGLYYDSTSPYCTMLSVYVSFIGDADAANIKNLQIKDSYFKGVNSYDYVGGICGYAQVSRISDCSFEGCVYGGKSYGICFNYNCATTGCYSVSNAASLYSNSQTLDCFHDNTLFTGTVANNSEGMPSSAFANGEVAYQIGRNWGQTIGVDAAPVLGGPRVYTLSATVETGAHGSFSCPSYANAGTVTFTSTPEPGYELVLKANGNPIAYSGNTFTMPAANTTLTADFVKTNYAVTTATDLTGGSVSAAATAQYQDQVTITATPAVGYVLDAISVTDASNNAVAVTNGKFTMPASAVSVSATFSPTGYVENGKVYGDWVVASDYTIAEGETLVIPAGTTVTTYGGAVIINNGTLKVEDEISGVTLAGDGVFNYTTLDKYDVTFGTATYNGSAITIGNGLDVTYATKTFCGKSFTFDAESCTITYLNNVNASVGTRYAVVTWDFSGNTATKEFAILKRELNLTGFIANNKNYDGTTQATGSFSDDRIAGDELEFNYKCAFDDENVGTGKNVSFYRIEIDGGADADNYELVTTEGSASANINKAPLTIKANDFTINVGDEMPTFTVEYDGFVAAQNVEVLSTLPTVGVDITDSSVAGTYDIIVSGAVADSYEITYINGTLTINPAIATAIDEVASADVKIYARGNIIVVENADSPIEVFDISGTRVERQSEILSRVEIPMAGRGVFVVRTGNISQKVIVK